MKKQILAFTTILAIAALSTASAQTIAQWTFESSVPTTAGPHAAEFGSGFASASHVGAAVYSNPVGNGSGESFSANTWAIDDYFQFSLSTVGYSGIGVSFDATGSGTGPKDFSFAYSTDGLTFSDFASYTVLLNGAPNLSWGIGSGYQSAYTSTFDLSSITALDNAPSVYFRLVTTSANAINGSSVGAGGTSRVDNFTVSVVPEPTSAALLGLGLTAWFIRRRR